MTDHPDSARWEITVGGETVGLLTYRLDGDVITLLHAEIDPSREGRGLGSELTRRALDDARRRGLRVRPRCPFVVAFMRSHADEYGDLVASPGS